MAHDSPLSGTNRTSTEARVETVIRPFSDDLADYLQSGSSAPRLEFIRHAKAINDLLMLYDPSDQKVDDLDPQTIRRSAFLARQLLEVAEAMEAHDQPAREASAEADPAVARLR